MTKTKAVFEAGDLVQLKSGGPKLVVVGDNNKDMVSVVWFNDGEFCDAEIEPCALVPVPGQ